MVYVSDPLRSNMEDLFLFFLVGMLGSELVKKIVDEKEAVRVPFLLLFSLCFTTVFFFFFFFGLSVNLLHSSPIDFQFAVKAALLVSPIFSISIYVMFKIKRENLDKI